LALKFDWEGFLKTSSYTNTQDYVAYIRRVGKLPFIALVNSTEGLPWLWKSREQSSAQVMSKYDTIVFRVDTANKCRPPQVRFVPMNYEITTNGNNFVVTMQEEIVDSGSRGCGMVAEFVLVPGVALNKEKEEIRRIAEERKRAELADRDRIIRQTNEDNKRETERYKRDIDHYKRDIKKYEVESKKTHHPCRGSGWKECTDMWHKGKSIMRECHTCHGKGGWKCMACDGTGLNYPKLQPPKEPKEPKMKEIPRFKDINSIDFTKGI